MTRILAVHGLVPSLPGFGRRGLRQPVRFPLQTIGGRVSIVVMAAALIAIFSTKGTARLITDCCVDCHVVHAWQDETERDGAVERAAVPAARTARGPTGLYASVLQEACEACHAHADSHTLTEARLNTVPIAKNVQEPDIALAGGNLYYSSGGLHLEKAGGSCTRRVILSIVSD